MLFSWKTARMKQFVSLRNKANPLFSYNKTLLTQSNEAEVSTKEEVYDHFR